MILDGTRPARGAIALDAGQNAPPRGATHREIEKPHDEQATIPLGIATCFLRPVRYNGAKAQGRRAVGIYLDVVFALNGTVNYALLCAAARVCGAPVRQRRLLAAAAVGAVYACLSFVPGAGFLAGAPWRLAALAAMLFIGFGRRLLLPGTVFLALSLAMGGLVLLLSVAAAAGDGEKCRRDRAGDVVPGRRLHAADGAARLGQYPARSLHGATGAGGGDAGA